MDTRFRTPGIWARRGIVVALLLLGTMSIFVSLAVSGKRSVTVGTLAYEPGSALNRVALPFTIRIDGLARYGEGGVPDRLKITTAGREATVSLIPGDEISIGGVGARIQAVHTWSGLLRHVSGDPLAMVSIRDVAGQWAEDIFLSNSTPRTFETGLTLLFVWHGAEADARAAMTQRLTGIRTARWGIIDDGRAHWTGSFLPGAGFTLSDGSQVTLLEVEESNETGSPERIRVRVVEASGAEEFWVSADAGSEGPVILDTSRDKGQTFVLRSWREGEALVGVYDRGRLEQVHELTAGQTSAPESMPFGMRLEQVLANAVPVEEANSPLMEAVLALPERRIRVRQGETVRVGDSTLGYVRLEDPVHQTWKLTILSDSGAEERVMVDPASAYRFTRNGITYALMRPEGSGDLVVQSEVEGYRPVPLWIGLSLLTVAGALVVSSLILNQRARVE